MKTKIKVAVSAGVLLLATAVQVEAKVSQEEADKLGKELTRMGANPKANAAGTIPAYTGTTLGVPKGVDYKGTGTYYPNPYPNEKPLFVIDAKNYEKYKENLTDGEIALFKKYPETFKMKIFPAKRDVRYDDRILNNIKRNATIGEIVASGNGTKNSFGGSPFPIPKNGVEVIWNHQYSPQPYLTEGNVASAAVFNNGSVSMRKQFESRYFVIFDPQKTFENFDGTSAKVLIEVTDPPREKGKVTLVHEFQDLSELPRNAWQYLPGTRRVRRAPTVAYDFPDGPGGLRTVDDALAFIGATDRYDWKLEPSRELYMPYNNYEADSPAHKYNEILTVNHPNPEIMRYELRRAWVVVGTLKEGKRHIYSKRRVYMDEDTWQGLLADNYDSQGSLWRTTMRTTVNAYDMPGMMARLELYHDLQKGAYLLNNLVNEEGGIQKIPAQRRPDDYYTPANLRVIGK
jgi:hypothetical protein